MRPLQLSTFTCLGLWATFLISIIVPSSAWGLMAFAPVSQSFSRGGRERCVQLKMMEEIECDVAIIGGGPAGCTCALYTSRANHKTVLIDKNPTTGALAITSTIANYPGVDTTMSGQDLLDRMRDQAVLYGTDYCRAQVFMVDFVDEYKMIYTPDVTYKARALVLATGAMGRQATFKGEEEFLGRGVSYCATCDGAFYQDSEVVVVGVDQEAMDEADFLTKFASTVHWITPTDLEMDNVNVQHLLSIPNVRHWKRTTMLNIEGDGSGVTGVSLKSRDGEEIQALPTEGVFIYVAGSKPITDFMGDKVIYNEDGGVTVNDQMGASVDGVYAIGDIRNTPFKQVVVAASDGCVAAMDIDRYLKGRRQIKVDWIHK